MPVAARCSWEVTAGLIPGEPPDPKYSRRWVIDSVQWADEANRDRLFSDTSGAAHAWAATVGYACWSGGDVNWVRVEFWWY